MEIKEPKNFDDIMELGKTLKLEGKVKGFYILQKLTELALNGDPDCQKVLKEILAEGEHLETLEKLNAKKDVR